MESGDGLASSTVNVNIFVIKIKKAAYEKSHS